MNRLYELVELTRKNTAAAKRIEKRLDALNKELEQERKEGTK